VGGGLDAPRRRHDQPDRPTDTRPTQPGPGTTAAPPLATTPQVPGASAVPGSSRSILADEMMEWVDFLARATDRHHLTREQILSALAGAVYDEPLPDDPTRHLVLGATDDGQPLEVVLVPQPDQRWLVIHAMPLSYRPPTHPHRLTYDRQNGDQP